MNRLRYTFSKIQIFFVKINLKATIVKNNQSTHMSLLLSQLYIMLLSLVIVIFTILLDNKSKIIMPTMDKRTFAGCLISFVIIFAFCELLYFISLRLIVPALTIFPITIIFLFVNFNKVNLRNEPFVLTDLLLARESSDITANFKLKFPIEIFAAVFVLILFVIVSFFIRKLNLFTSYRVRLAYAGTAFSFLMIFPVFFFSIPSGNTYNIAGVYNKNGFITGFLTSIKQNFIMFKSNINDEIYLIGPDEEIPDISELPNVIVIMNESFWDLNNLTGVEFNTDPMESVRGIMNNIGQGSLLSPQNGGGTANVEYEFLTGKSSMFYPTGSMIYEQYITKKTWSLARYFKNLKYAISAIHPYESWFWRRSRVYPLLGFENIIFAKDMLNKEIKGQFISDMSLTREIINEYKILSKNDTVPFFNFSVSMQNHGYYYENLYKNQVISILNKPKVDIDEAFISVEVFGEGIRYASEAFVSLTEYFEDITRPTYIIMFGDHAPYFSTDPQFYKNSSGITFTDEDMLNMYRTPIVIWSNTGESFGDLGTMSAFILTAKLFDIAGLPKPDYIKFFDTVAETTSGFSDLFILDKNGNPAPEDQIKEINKIISAIREYH